MTGALRRAVLALVALGLVGVSPAVPETAAVTPDLTIVGDATYEAVPGERLVRVRVDLVARNHLRDSTTRRYYFDRAFLAVPPGATAFRLASPTGRPSVRVARRGADHQLLALAFGQRVAAGKSARFTLTFELADSGGTSAGDVRVGEAFVSFPVWAYGYPNGVAGSAARVVLPAGYTVGLRAGDLRPGPPDDEGRVVLETGELRDATAFSAWVTATRPATFEDTSIEPLVSGSRAAVTIRAWPDDPGWASRVGGVFERGLPVLGDLVGLDWSRDAPLVVEETAGVSGGHVGLFEPAAGRMEVAWYAGSFIVLHEAAHAWFDGELLADRWASEAFASYYAVAAAARLEEAVSAPELSEGLLAVRFPLNAWSADAATDPARRTEEAYGYAASLALAREIADRAGFDGLRSVWRAIAAGEAAYQPPSVDAAAARPAERAAGPPDWRGLLDLLEDRTAARYDDLWREWVVRESDARLLDARRAARDRYEEVVRSAGRWELPAAVRDALRHWQFDRAEILLREAEALLERRAQLERAAAEAGLRLPPRLEAAFEGDAGFAVADAEADAEAATIAALVAAAEAEPVAPGPLEQLGMLGAQPGEALAAARRAFSSGDLAAAAAGASEAYASWAGAENDGRSRILAAIGAAILAVLAILVALPRARAWRVDRRRDQVGSGTAEPPSTA